MSKEPVVIVGAGPAGLASAYEFIRAGIRPLVLERADKVGGLARTEEYKGCYFDLGGHRFFTKSEKINQLWREMLGGDLLKVPRKSRIYHQGRFLKYPLDLSNILSTQGVMESLLILMSYFKAHFRPHREREEKNFEQWVSNRFGRRLFNNFFKTYTEKVWGIPCQEIKADWAEQRINDLSLISAVSKALFNNSIGTRSLITEFYYPRKGAGMMWQKFQEAIEAGGGRVRLNSEVTSIEHENGSVVSVTYGTAGGETKTLPVGHLISSLPINRLVSLLDPKAPDEVLAAAGKLRYRDFFLVGIIVGRKDLFPDQWIYIHSPDLKVGRIQNFKNWSASMIHDPRNTNIGMEYFCTEGDEVWKMSDAELMNLASRELAQLGLAEIEDVIDGFVIRQVNAYPIYDLEYDRHLKVVRDFITAFDNIQTVGRSGMHRYNNMDHSMHMGMLAAEIFMGADHDLWAAREDKEY